MCLLVVVAALCSLVSTMDLVHAAAAADQRAYAGGHVLLEINGERQVVSSIEGGSAVGVVAVNGTDKSINGVAYEDIVATVPATSLPAVVRDAMSGKASGVNGAIDYADFDYKGQRRVGFQNAIISAVRFPALDGASKDAANVEIVLSPEVTREEKPAGDVKGAIGSKQQKRAMVSAFRVTIPDVPETNRVATVSAIEWRAKAAQGATGAQRFPAKQPPQYEIPNIKLTVAANSLKSFQDWLDQTLKDGGSKHEKTMRIELLDANMKDPLLTLELSGVGIVAVRMKKAEAGNEAIQRAEVELYAEQLKFTGGGGVTKTAEAAAAEPAKTTETVAKEAPAEAPATIQRPIRRAR
jgi:hypothetical protein